MADGDFLGGLFGGVRDAGSALYGLLGGPSGTPSAANTPTDMLQQLSPEEQRRLTASTLGQLGASLLAAGQKQMPAQRAQALAQLGNIGPNIDMQLQRAVAVRNQQEALRRLRSEFPLEHAVAYSMDEAKRRVAKAGRTPLVLVDRPLAHCSPSERGHARHPCDECSTCL